MATATELSTRALRRLQIVDALETPSAADIAYVSDALGAMIASWETKWFAGDVLPLHNRFEQAIVALLAVRVAEDYGKTAGPTLLRDARDGLNALRAAFIPSAEAEFDPCLINMPSRMMTDAAPRSGTYAWGPGLHYQLGQCVTNINALYECVTEGLSAAAGGPTGTGSEITDGTAVWCFRHVVANSW